MEEKLTHTEHKARAMLMGLEYEWQDGTYCTALGTVKGVVLACDTLEPVGAEEISARYAQNNKPSWFQRPNRETPWARM